MDSIIGFYNYRVVATYFPAFMAGLGVTLLVSAWALVIALTIGTIVALMNISKRRWLNLLASAYIQAIRSTPLLIQVYLVYFALGVIPLLDRRLLLGESGHWDASSKSHVYDIHERLLSATSGSSWIRRQWSDDVSLSDRFRL